ncbi:MAG: hypothetical protein BIFFINMI_04208 [Phycisphaerae bacterium]|nr:hypothetical protein [Phycisphaerae bacterium]
MKIRIKRISDAPSQDDGYRVLVDRLWLRGARKDDARLGEWAKELSPSDALRTWFGHDPEKWPEFHRRFTKELADKKDDVAAIFNRSPKKTVTLLFAATDSERNNAVVLREFLVAYLSK